jgi:hypothetical protein
MSTSIVEISSAKIPSYLSKVLATVTSTNTDLTQNVGAGFPVLSIKGKVFTLVKSQERTVICRPDDPEEAAVSLEVVLLKANPHLSKVWYAKEFEDGEMGKPDCFSDDGTLPDASATSPQCKTCAACPKNVFGSARNGKGKACQDARRVAIAGAGQINEPMLLRVPPASLKPLSEYGKTLNHRGVPYNAVVTELRFEREEATPKLKFKAVRFLTEAEYTQVMEVMDDVALDDILACDPPNAEQNPLGVMPAAALGKVNNSTFEQVMTPAPEAKPVPAPEAKSVPQPAPAEEPGAVVDDLDVLLAGLDD